MSLTDPPEYSSGYNTKDVNLNQAGIFSGSVE